jgi:hypothetical protein
VGGSGKGLEVAGAKLADGWRQVNLQMLKVPLHRRVTLLRTMYMVVVMVGGVGGGGGLLLSV